MPLNVRAGASMDSDAMLADARRRIRRLEKRPSGSPLGLLLGIGTASWASGLWSSFTTNAAPNYPSGGSPTITVEYGDPDLAVADGEEETVEYLKLAASNQPCLYVITVGATVSSDNNGTHEVIDLDVMFRTDDTSLYVPSGVARGALIFGTSSVSTPSVGGAVTLPLPGSHFILAQVGASSSSTTGTHITVVGYGLRVLRFSLPA